MTIGRMPVGHPIRPTDLSNEELIQQLLLVAGQAVTKLNSPEAVDALAIEVRALKDELLRRLKEKK